MLFCAECSNGDDYGRMTTQMCTYIYVTLNLYIYYITSFIYYSYIAIYYITSLYYITATSLCAPGSPPCLRMFNTRDHANYTKLRNVQVAMHLDPFQLLEYQMVVEGGQI